MKKIAFPNREIWFGYHSEVGGFIYDKSAQIGLPSKKVRLFILKEQKTNLFIADILKDNLIKFDNTIFEKNKILINAFIKELTNRVITKRITHCWGCKRNLDSVNYEICSKCKWIKCGCNACGCGWQRFHKDM